MHLPPCLGPIGLRRMSAGRGAVDHAASSPGAPWAPRPACISLPGGASLVPTRGSLLPSWVLSSPPYNNNRPAFSPLRGQQSALPATAPSGDEEGGFPASLLAEGAWHLQKLSPSSPLPALYPCHLPDTLHVSPGGRQSRQTAAANGTISVGTCRPRRVILRGPACPRSSAPT